jgi:hypothetical protein
MNPEPQSPAADGSLAPGNPKGRSVGWQLFQIAVLSALLLAGMYAVDRDAKALAEKHARAALVRAVQADAERSAPATAAHQLEQAIRAYAKVCAECAEPMRCEQVIQTIRAGKTVPAGRGPCKEGILERRSPDEAARSSSAQ